MVQKRGNSMKKMKWFLSIILPIVLIVGLITSLFFSVGATMLPLKEERAFLVLDEKTDEEIKAIPLSYVLSHLQDKHGNYIEIDPNAEVVWAHFKDDQGITIRDEYHVMNRDETVDMSEYGASSNYQLELIVGSGNQLDYGNKRYLINVYLTKTIQENLRYELYKQDGDVREKITPKRTITNVSDVSGVPAEITFFLLDDKDYSEGQYYYLGMQSDADDHPNCKLKIFDLNDFPMELIARAGKDLSSGILDQNMEEKDAGYKSQFEMSSDLSKELESFPEKCLILAYYDNMDKMISWKVLALAVKNDTDLVYLDGELNTYNSTHMEPASVVEALTADVDSLKLEIDESGNTNGSIIEGKYYMLKEGLSEDDDYYYSIQVKTKNGYDNSVVSKAVVGIYDSIESANAEEDIKDELCPKSLGKIPYGYKANYSAKNNGQFFTIFLDDGTTQKINVRITEYDPEYDPNAFAEYTSAPIVGKKDPWFRVDGVNQNGKPVEDVFVVENGKAINMDTLYGYGYQTLFINDPNVDLTTLQPTFWFGDPNRVSTYESVEGEENPSRYENRADTYVGERQQSGITKQDFSDGAVQYTTIIDDNHRNYNVKMIQKQTGGPKLYVNGPSERTVFLDQYFEEKHDILIANIGDEALTDINVELLDAKNVELDDYWTVGGEGNDTLAPFTSTVTTTQYGILPNLAKIRLVPPNGVKSGDIEGTLKITAKGQAPQYIKLSGRVNAPKIIKRELSSAVKWVPYSYVISTNNMNEWNTEHFSITDGRLPEGLSLNEGTGEIYGAPKETGSFTFTVRVHYDYFSEADDAYETFHIDVKDNQNQIVYEQTDSGDGYSWKKTLGQDNNDYLFIVDEDEEIVDFSSNGEFREFQKVWLNGDVLDSSEYEAESGSTKITIKTQTLKSHPTSSGVNTIALEFRVGGLSSGDLKRTSENFSVKYVEKVDGQVVKVIDLIGNIPSAGALQLSDKTTVSVARNAYDNLSQIQQSKVTNYSTLVTAEEIIIELEIDLADHQAANIVIQMIDNIPDAITLAIEVQIEGTRENYEALTGKQKGYVTNYPRLLDAEGAINQIKDEIVVDKQAATAVDNAIASIPTPITKESEDAIKSARIAYNNLTSAQKPYVSGYNQLVSYEDELLQLQNIDQSNGKDEEPSLKQVILVFEITDKKGVPLADHLVELHSEVQEGKTDANGYIRFSNVEMGSHTVTVKTSSGDVIATKTITIADGTKLQIDGETITATAGSIFTIKLSLDGTELTIQEVSKGDRTPEQTNDEDSRIVQISPNTRSSALGDGNSTGSGNFTSNTQKGTSNYAKPAATSDESKLLVWSSLSIVSLLCLASLVLFETRKE